MSLRKKTFLIICAILITFIIIRHIIVRNSLLGYYDELEKKTLLVNLQRIKDIIKERLSEFSKITTDYANWDDTYNYIKIRNPEFITSSLNPKSLAQLKLNMALITDTLKDIVFAREVDIRSGYTMPGNYLAGGLLSREEFFI